MLNIYCNYSFGGIGLAVLLISMAKSINIDLMSYLFGSLTTIIKEDIYNGDFRIVYHRIYFISL